MHGQALDVVIVPDFAGAQRRVFEARALFLLASWAEHGGGARDFPLHVACIGEPPLSVRWLAHQCGAEVSVHQPLGLPGCPTANKLRGLEVRARGRSVLLVDVDVLVLDDFSELARLGYGIAAGPAVKPHLPRPYWKAIYAALGMEAPTRRMACIAGEIMAPDRVRPDLARKYSRLTAMFPYYNSGVLLAPWDCGLRPIWEEHIRRIAAQFDEADPHWRRLGRSDEAGLATATELLRQRGVPSVRLPDAYHTHWQHVWSGAQRWPQTKLFHAQGSFQTPAPTALDADSLRWEIARFCGEVRERRRFSLGRGLQEMVGWDVAGAEEFIARLETELHGLLHRHVAPALLAAARPKVTL
jgi:hypothetical protein